MLQAGTQLGVYEVLSPLGAGGMGEVYRARDTKLGRDVALKVLADTFVHDRERMARFRREAQLLASLNHNNVAAIYGIEESGGTMALVMELVDGETLAERIAKGRVPLQDALRIALQIAEALEAAHEKAVIHRDLKPANVKITSQGVVKVLDFGLAKALDDEPGPSNFSQSPTLSAALTGAGYILGTAGYMAPEQARGKVADRRADIWAFGVILFEMLTGRRLFEGETAADTLAKVLERDPDLKQLPPRTPAAVRKLLQRCLNKNVKDRLQAIGDARTLIQELTLDPTSLVDEAQAPPYPLWKKLLPWAVAMILGAGLVLRPSPSPPKSVLSRFEFVLPGGQNLTHQYRHAVTLSPDGTRMAFVANTLGRSVSEQRIYIKGMDQWEAVAIPGTEAGLNPFFSPDGQWLGFQSGSQIKKVHLTGGTPVTTVASVGGRPLYGMSWGANGNIVFAPEAAGALKVMRDTGSEAEEFTKLDIAANEVSHRLPHFLPDGSGVLFTVLRYTYVEPNWSTAQIWVKSLKDGKSKRLLEKATDARYIGNGYLVFAREGQLFVVRFDLKTLSVLGTAAPVLDGVTHSTYAAESIFDWTGAAQFSVAENGSLAFAPGSTEPPRLLSMVWVDRHGKVSPLGTKPVALAPVRVSPDGRRVAFTECCREKGDISVFDTQRQVLEQQKSEGHSFRPIWSPDGSRIAFRSNRDGPSQVYVKDVDAPGLTPITPGPHDEPGSWTPDGKEFAYVHAELKGAAYSYDIYVASTGSPNKVRPLLDSPAAETYPEFSPDGRWLAYSTDESGRSEVYVQPYPGPGKRVLVSIDGGAEPAWSRDGKELFYRIFRNPGGDLMSVRFTASNTEFIPEKPVRLFAWNFQGGAIARIYDVAPDGRFLALQQIPDVAGEWNKKVFPSTIRIVLNWSEELRRIAER